MSNSIDPDSIHLGGTDAKYYAEYFPSTPPAPDTPCALPPEIVWDTHKVPLLPLDQTCQFTFPDITPLPPIYNPPVFNFAACEALTTDVKFTVSKPLRGSTLTLTTKGPEAGSSGLSECGFILTQDLKLPDVCESFKADTNINFGKNLRNSKLKLVVKDTPDCGFTLQGNLDINDVCETADLSVDIAFTGAAKNSYVTSTPTTPGGCDTTLTGLVTVEACETFSATTDVTFGKKLSKSSLTLSSSSIPDCGFELIGNIDIGEVCETANIISNVAFGGAARKSTLSISPIPSGPDDLSCDSVLAGTIQVDACETFDASVDIKFGKKLQTSSLSFIPKNIPDCGFDLTGEIDIDGVCETANMTTNVTFVGAAKWSKLDFSPKSSMPGSLNCDSVLAGTIQVDACESFDASVDIKFGKKLQRYSYLTFTPKSLPDCGFSLTGDIDIDIDDVCETAELTSTLTFKGAAKTSRIEIKDKISNFPTCDKIITGEIEVIACEEFKVESRARITGPIIKTNTLALTSTSFPKCGFILDGDLEFKDEVCVDFQTTNNFELIGRAIKPTSNIQLVAKTRPECGFELAGNLEIEACTDMGLSIRQAEGSGRLLFVIPETPLQPKRILAEVSSLYSFEVINPDPTNPCSTEIVYRQEDIEINLEAASVEVSDETLEIVEGKDYRREEHALRLKKDGNTVSLGGGGCCSTDFSCSGPAGPLMKTSIILDKLKIKYEEWAAPECCEQTCGHHYMDWCPGIGEWKTWYLKTIEPSPCCGGSDSKIDMCAGTVDLGSAESGAYMRMSKSSGIEVSTSLGISRLSGSSLSLGGGECSDTKGSILQVDITQPSPCCQTNASVIDLCKGLVTLGDLEGNALNISPDSLTIKSADGKSITLDSSGLKVDSSGNICEGTSEFTTRTLRTDQISATECCESASQLDLCDGSLYLEKDGASARLAAGQSLEIKDSSENSISVGTEGIKITGPDGTSIELSTYGFSVGGEYCASDITLSAHLLTAPDCCETKGSQLNLCEGNLYLEKGAASIDLTPGEALTLKAESGDSVSVDTSQLQITSADGTQVTFSATGMSVASSCSGEKIMFELDRIQSTSCENGRNYMDFGTGWLHLEDEEGNYSDIIAGKSITLTTTKGDSVDIRESGIIIKDASSNELNLIPGTTIHSKDSSGGFVDITPGSSMTVENSSGANGTLGIDGLYMNNAAGDEVNIYIIQGKTATWREMTFCVDGKDKKAWVLMTEPE